MIGATCASPLPAGGGPVRLVVRHPGRPLRPIHFMNALLGLLRGGTVRGRSTLATVAIFVLLALVVGSCE